jgi:hypothetical protein
MKKDEIGGENIWITISLVCGGKSGQYTDILDGSKL